MTAQAEARDVGMVKAGAAPCICRMAVVTFCNGLYMCRMLACRRYIIVAAAAWAGCVDVVKTCASPCVGVMAITALCSGLYM
jgi:hypothetical protein